MDKKFMNIHFDLGKAGEISANMDEELNIDTSSPEVIANQLDKSAAIMYYWGSISETAVKLDAKVKTEYDKWWAGVYTEVKADLLDKLGKTSTTESSIKNEVIRRYPDEYEKWAKEIANSKYRKNRLNWAKECFSKKNDNLGYLLAYHRRLAERIPS